MKIFLIGCLLFSACTQNNNDNMNKLLSQKKQAEDSLSYYQNYQAFYSNKFRDEKDSILKEKYFDTTSSHNINALITEARLEAINYSIDSLGKLK